MKTNFYTFAEIFRMRRLRLLCCLIVPVLLLSCGGGVTAKRPGMTIPKDSTQVTSIQWLDSTTRNFGTIAEGMKLEVKFRFRNSGDKPLIIEQVRPSCGCTVAEQPDEPVMPGKEGIIRASFNSEGRTGVNHKTLYVMANTKGDPSNALAFTVTVEKKKW